MTNKQERCSDAMSDYNGWKNYETWCVALWIDNDEGLCTHWKDRARSIADTTRSRYSFETDAEAARGTLADELKDSIEDHPLADAGLYADLLNAALGDVDWHAVADHLGETTP